MWSEVASALTCPGFREIVEYEDAPTGSIPSFLTPKSVVFVLLEIHVVYVYVSICTLFPLQTSAPINQYECSYIIFICLALPYNWNVVRCPASLECQLC